jgi:formylglycine-generating enzyme required for sulfatase activity
MGAAADSPSAEPDERPRQMVFLDAFRIDATEVTNVLFASCEAAVGAALLTNNAPQTGLMANRNTGERGDWFSLCKIEHIPRVA